MRALILSSNLVSEWHLGNHQKRFAVASNETQVHYRSFAHDSFLIQFTIQVVVERTLKSVNNRQRSTDVTSSNRVECRSSG